MESPVNTSLAADIASIVGPALEGLSVTPSAPSAASPDELLANQAIASLDAEPAAEEAPAEAVPAVEAAPATEETTGPEVILDDEDLDLASDATAPAILDLTQPRGKRIYESYRFVKALAAPPEQGGIGHEPTVADIAQYHNAYLNLERLVSDLAGDPTVLIGNLEQTDPNVIGKIATALPGYLAARNPQAYEQMANGVVSNAVEAILNHARSMATPEAKQAWFYVAQGLQYYMSDGQKTIDISALQAPAADPLATREQQLSAREKEIAARDREARNQAVGTFHQTLVNETNHVLVAEIERVLVPVKGKLPAGAYQGIVQSMLIGVQNAVKSNSVAYGAIQTEMRKAGKVIGDPSLEQAHRRNIIGRYVQYARPSIYAARAEALKGFNVRVAQQAAKSAAAAPAASTNRPLPGGSPAKAATTQTGQTGTQQAKYRPNNAESTLSELRKLMM